MDSQVSSFSALSEFRNSSVVRLKTRKLGSTTVSKCYKRIPKQFRCPIENKKVNFRKLKPRGFIFIRQIMIQLLNAHLVNRITSYLSNKLNDANTSRNYLWYKKRLNEYRSFSQSLEEMFENWDYKSLDVINLAIKEETVENEEGINNNVNDNNQIDLVKIPKRNKLDYYNTTEGTIQRMTSIHPTDHMAVTFKRSRCILCHCDTTVCCGTCEVHLCKNAFDENNESCFKKFHSIPTLILSPRNGRMFRRMGNNNDNIVDDGNNVTGLLSPQQLAQRGLSSPTLSPVAKSAKRKLTQSG